MDNLKDTDTTEVVRQVKMSELRLLLKEMKLRDQTLAQFEKNKTERIKALASAVSSDHIGNHRGNLFDLLAQVCKSEYSKPEWTD